MNHRWVWMNADVGASLAKPTGLDAKENDEREIEKIRRRSGGGVLSSSRAKEEERENHECTPMDTNGLEE